MSDRRCDQCGAPDDAASPVCVRCGAPWAPAPLPLEVTPEREAAWARLARGAVALAAVSLVLRVGFVLAVWHVGSLDVVAAALVFAFARWAVRVARRRDLDALGVIGWIVRGATLAGAVGFVAVVTTSPSWLMRLVTAGHLVVVSTAMVGVSWVARRVASRAQLGYEATG
ncbi:MAG: hypothetical protein JNK72_15630 [Myxococcales bacterium]|nr:hypothetical protein [Myxococcales bacterium]